MNNITRTTIELDATGVAIGRLATKIAQILIGKHKASYEAHVDGGDRVVVRNAAKVNITGKKLEQKHFYQYSGYPGGMRADNLGEVMVKDAAKALRHAVAGMLPKNRLKLDRMKRLSVKND